MDPSVQRALVVGRLLGVATTVLALGAGAHVLGGGHAPSAGPLVLLGALVLAGAAVVARRPLSTRVLLPLALGGQLTVHAALTWLAPRGAVPGPGPGPAGVHTAHDALPATAATLSAAAPAAGTAHGGGLMLAAHVAALVATVLLLVATDRGVLALARRWSALLPVLAGRLPGPVGRRTPAVAGAVAPPRRLPVLRGGVGRRGPPVPPRPRTA